MTWVTRIALFVIVFAQDPARDRWNAPQAPFKVFGNTYYVGPHGVGVVLITSDAGHVLIDGGLPESVPAIVDRIRQLGFRIQDVKLILNSHVHYDHAGGIGELQKLSGARVTARAASAKVFRSGKSGKDDPQFGILPDIDTVPRVELVDDGKVLRVGPIAITAHSTGGHTPGGTSWTWKSCEGSRCLDLVYADSLNPVSADGFRFTDSKTYRTAVADFDRGIAFMESVPCDILVSAHPEFADLWTRLDRRDKGEADALIDRGACRRYADNARTRLRERLATERKPASK